MALGRLRLPAVLGTRWLPLVANWEQVILAVFAPRTGKTSALAVPAVLNAPGAVTLTSSKADLVLLTAQVRAADTRQRVWVFDPQQIMHVEQTWTWNPLAGDLSFDDITRLAAAFVLTVDSGARGDIWAPAARELIANLLLAAHTAQLTLVDAYAWLMDETAKMPVLLLRRNGFAAAAQSLAGTQALNERTRGSVYWTARTALSCLRIPGIARWVTPQPGLAAFDPQRFVASRQTLYLLSKDASGGTTAGPLVAALADRVRLCAERLGERRGGRMDPPLLLVLDEAANIARIDDLPSLYSHLGSRSIIPITILQSVRAG